MSKSNPIGTGTRNLTLNAPKEWALELARAACQCGLSLGEYLRRLTERGMELENPGCALRLRHIRQQYYGAVVLLLLAYIAILLLRPGTGWPAAQFTLGIRLHP